MARVDYWNGEQLAKAAREAALEVAETTAEVVGGVAVNKAPLDESTLRGSKTVNKIEKGYEISFNTPYAVAMHEWQGYTPSHPGTGPNYLRGPLLEAEEKYHQDIAAAMKAIFG